MHTLWHSIRYAWRLLARAPGFAATAVLALGVGACTALYTVVHAVLLPTARHGRTSAMVAADDEAPLRTARTSPILASIPAHHEHR